MFVLLDYIPVTCNNITEDLTQNMNCHIVHNYSLEIIIWAVWLSHTASTRDIIIKPRALAQRLIIVKGHAKGHFTMCILQSVYRIF